MIVCAVLQHSLKRLAFLCCKLQPANIVVSPTTKISSKVLRSFMGGTRQSTFLREDFAVIKLSIGWLDSVINPSDRRS